MAASHCPKTGDGEHQWQLLSIGRICELCAAVQPQDARMPDGYGDDLPRETAAEPGARTKPRSAAT